MSDTYDAQDRGAGDAYARYLAGMDASMRQKVALVAAHLLCEGEVADMGMGSGAGSHALAALYPRLDVVGIDINPEMVERARARYALPNLRFEVGDIAEACLPAGVFEAILDSSVLHHVTSFNGYDRGAAARAMGVQARMLAPGGVLVVRDFLDPGAGEVWLDLPDDDAPPEGPGAGGSSAALLLRFSKEFKLLLPEGERGFPVVERGGRPGEPPLPTGWRRFALDRRHAVEFLLRKDYRRDWALEAQEEYTYLTQAGFEAACAAEGLRLLASTPIRNPWIVQHRFEGRFAWWTTAGVPLDWPATNYVVAAERVDN